MRIEIAEPGRMTQSGSSLLRLIQNNNMPLLDLLVREAVQNSLDAKDDSDSKYVTVKFLTGNFEKNKLNSELDGVTEALNRKFTDNICSYIAIRDNNTVGLTGKLHYSEVDDNHYGNLLKLIYEISKPQETEGAGGSWGLGKTVYFRIGIGLVIYYSRIKNEKGQYESRLAASLVEDETKSDSLIPVYKGMAKRGIAWWGEEFGENQTKPVTDSSYIKRILEIFDIPEYCDNETGTTIIIPYIDQNKLLGSNQVNYQNTQEMSIIPVWRKNGVDEYINISLQRWYAPRLANPDYQYGKFLKAYVNSELITYDSMEPLFQIIHSLYRKTVNSSNDDILSQNSLNVKIKEIRLKNILKSEISGKVVYTKVPDSVLKMTPPDNKHDPYMYLNLDILNKENNKPIVCFTRKPGMIVSYEQASEWTDGIEPTAKGEFIVGIYVLNSENRLTITDKDYSLEEYVRKSEMADHTSWNDFSIKNKNPGIISRVQSHVRKKIAEDYRIDEKSSMDVKSSAFGRMFSKLLPPEDFGGHSRCGCGSENGGSSGGMSQKTVGAVVSFLNEEISYTEDGITIPVILKINGKTDKTILEMYIDSVNGEISTDSWERTIGLPMPFEIYEYDIVSDKNKIMTTVTADKEDKISGVLYSLITTDDSKIGYKVAIEYGLGKKFKVRLNLKIRKYRNDMRTVIKLGKVD